MSKPINSFISTNHNDFTWPSPRPLMPIPSQPPKITSTQLYLSRPDVDQCDCDSHNYETDYSRYKNLANQESQLRDNIIKVNNEMTALLSRILDNNIKPEEEIMKSTYQSTYEQSRAPITHYRSLISAVDSPVGDPIKPVIKELKNAYRNSNRFCCNTGETSSHIEPAEKIDLTRVPQMFSSWNKPFIGRSEYMDTISKFGLSNLKNQTQYLEPIPSSRKRWGNRNP